MPLTAKGEEIKSAMSKQYGAKKGEEVFYASKNKGTISGVDSMQRDDAEFEVSYTGGDGVISPDSFCKGRSTLRHRALCYYEW